MLRIAVPVVVAEIGWVAMGVVDVMMVGRIDAESIGAVSVGRAAFMLVAIAGIGLLLGLDTVIAQAYGAGDMRGCHLGLLHGTYLSLIMTAPLMLTGYAFLLFVFLFVSPFLLFFVFLFTRLGVLVIFQIIQSRILIKKYRVQLTNI